MYFITIEEPDLFFHAVKVGDLGLVDALETAKTERCRAGHGKIRFYAPSS
jgi:hypothetical protein